MTPEHLHLALNHLPIIGLGTALIPLVIGILTHNRGTVVAGLVIAMVCGWSTPIVMESGEEAYDRYEDPPISGYLDSAVKHELHEHEERAERGSKLMYAAAILASVGLLVGFWRPGLLRPVAVLTTLACLAAIGAGVWIADAGGKIRRPDFRTPAPGVQAGGAVHAD